MIKKIFCVILLCSITFAQDYSFSPEWLRLLYYEKDGSGYKSLANDQEFFISSQGQSDPTAEYEAELNLVLQDDTKFKNKFPLRYKYITRQNNLEYKPIVIPASDIENIILAYPNRYMSNPASMFGHLFFVLETKQGMLDSKILHFAADTRGTPMNLVYAYKGLTGGFSGYFAEEMYYKKIKDYNYSEDREVFYYEITLTQEQIEDLQLHYIEVQNISFPYYFIDGNCALFLGRFLNVVLAKDIIQRGIYLTPAQVINELEFKKLLTAERVRISATKAFDELYNTLNWTQKTQVGRLLQEPAETINADTETLQAFLRISEYMISNRSEYAEIIRHNRIFAYQKLSETAVPEIRQEVQLRKDIEKIKDSSIQIAWYGNHYMNFAYTPIRFSEADSFNNLAQIDVRMLGLGVQIGDYPRYKIDLLEIDNITQANAILPTISWSIKSQFSYANSFSTNQEIYIGQAVNLFNKSLLYVLVGGNYTNYNDLAEQDLEKLDLLSGAKIGIQQNINNNIKLLFVFLDNPDLCIKRIKDRVADGGHNVPDRDVIRRFLRGKQNFLNIIKCEVIDYWALYYNGGVEYILVVQGKQDHIDISNNDLYDRFIEGAKNG